MACGQEKFVTAPGVPGEDIHCGSSGTPGGAYECKRPRGICRIGAVRLGEATFLVLQATPNFCLEALREPLRYDGCGLRRTPCLFPSRCSHLCRQSQPS